MQHLKYSLNVLPVEAWLLMCLLLAVSNGAIRAGEPVQSEAFEQAGIVQAWKTYQHKLTFGKGQTLALVDDGYDLSMPEWSKSDGDQPKVLVAYDSVDGDDDPKHEGKGYHGSTIGIPSSLNYQGKWGVAYNDQVAVIRALECCHCNVSDGETVAAALQWIIDNHKRYRITTVNLAPVDDKAHNSPVATAIDDKLAKLRELGVWVSAPTGNHNFTDGISWPACQPNCFSIGAVRQGRDEVYLDRHAKVDLVVPAAATSSSNAIACGAAIVIREAMMETGYDWKQDGPNMAEAILAVMQKTGVKVEDAATKRSYQRLDLAAALDHVFAVEKKSAAIRFSEHLIADKYAYAYGIAAADFDRDGDMDLLCTGRKVHQVIWYENHRDGGSLTWKKHLIDDKSPCPAHGNPADMDGDGDLDVVLALGFYYRPGSDDPSASLERDDNQVVWYENDGKPAAGPWKKHVIGPQFDDAFEAIAADLDDDGDIDVAATSWRNPGRAVWFENHGDPRGNWTLHTLKNNWRSANQVIIADLNGDGRPDIAACAEHGSYELRWWRNEGPSDVLKPSSDQD